MKKCPRWFQKIAESDSNLNVESLLSTINRAPLLCFDFDGTLVDSNPIKLSAFDELFQPHAAFAQEIAAYTHAHHHTPRWEKFRHVYKEILKQPYNDKIEKDLSERYEQLTTTAVVKAPFIRGADRFLVSLKGKTTGLLSSTPHDILVEILARRNLSGFDAVKGAPVKKFEWLAAWAKEWKADPSECVYFGDSEEDRRAAEKGGWIFVGVANENLAGGKALFVKDFDILNPPKE